MAAQNFCQKKGFTLVELLIVISIIAILSVVGITVFTGIQKGARDARRKGDIDAIAKAYEVKYSNSGSYGELASQDFASNSIPKDPTKGEYFNVIDSSGQGSKVCAALENNPNTACNTPAVNCYCLSSIQGTIASGTGITLFGTHTLLGIGGSSAAPSCDPDGTLLSGLVGYWKMDEASWTVDCSTTSVTDSSGAGNNGKSCPATTGPAGGVTGKFGNGGSFDGSNDYVGIASNNSLGSSLATFTISAWVKKNSDSDYNGIVNHESDDAATGHYHLRYDPGGRVYALAGHYQSGYVVGVAGGGSPTAWRHLATTFDGTTLRVYLDGVLLGSDNTGSYSPANDTTEIGRVERGGGSIFDYTNGSIDEVRIYNRALSSQEISSLYNSGNGCI